MIDLGNNLALVPKMAEMSLVTALAQNQALQANNEANEQVLLAFKSMQTVFQVLVDENVQLKAKLLALEAKIEISDRLHQEQIKALTNQVTAVQSQSTETANHEVALEARTNALEDKLEEKYAKVKECFNKHVHLDDKLAHKWLSTPSINNSHVIQREPLI